MLILFLTFDTPEDTDKFLLLYEKYRKIIYYTLTRFKFDEYTKEDLSHDIYIKLASHLDDIDISDSKKTTKLHYYSYPQLQPQLFAK